VEEGTRLEVLGDAQHPYTAGLLRSMPALSRPGERLPEIPGVVPSPGSWPQGCRFSTRCERVFDPCRERVPTGTTLSGTHTARCHDLERERQA
jgi:oligopeptide/dipeptide ABC transporter ATP-binding protein